MKKLFASALMLTTLFAVKAQTVTEDSFSRLAFSIETPSVTVDAATIGSTKYLQSVLEGYTLTGNVGDPALPVLTRTIVLPFCGDVSISVANAVYDTIQADVSLPWYPYQPSVSKSDWGQLALYFNKDAYLVDTFYSLPLVQVSDIAVARDRRIATLTFAPVSLNPVTNQYVVCRTADVTVNYHGVDTAMTNDYYARYHTPAFAVNGKLNDLTDEDNNTKAIRHSAPVRMVVVIPTSLNCTAVAKFVDWKRRCGMIVDVLYYGTSGLTSNTALADRLKSLYDNASAEAPAPTYLLLVGDHAQLPAFSSRLNTTSVGTDHITDLYYVTWTSGDIVPDCYQGRLSATDTSTLTSIINKTLFYETYSFPNDNYLAKAILISGVDNGYLNQNDYAYVYADPTMDYAARYYINQANGFTTVKYYKNNTSFAPDSVTVTGSSGTASSAATIRNHYTAGYGWINYSAHGDWDRWHQPQMTVNHVGSMNNVDKPSFMIGNCCLTNKFEKNTCFGEALLRRPNNAGAVAYIGGTNSTYWSEDFYWSVGVRSNISNTMNTTYNASRLGVYDRLFHTHGESRANQAITAGAMVFHGNNSVNSSSTSTDKKKYYWEIYELMGDPSLMPWLGRARDLTNFSYALSGSTIYVTTEPSAYVAIVDTLTHNLVAAAYATLSGSANLSIPAGVDLAACSFAVTAQGYKPYFSVNMQPILNFEKVEVDFSLYPNPATDRCTIVADSIVTVLLLDSRGTVVSTYTPAGNTCTIDLSALPRGIYFVQVQTADSMSARKLIVR